LLLRNLQRNLDSNCWLPHICNCSYFNDRTNVL